MNEYYTSHNNIEGAIEVANKALAKCRDSKITEGLIFLIKDAYKTGNKTEVVKLYRRAKQRKSVLISELNKVLGGEQ